MSHNSAKQRLRPFGVALLAAAAFLHTPSQSAAQAAPSGLWWAVSAGAGSAHLTCDLCQPGRDFGPSLVLSVGAWAGPWVRVGVEGGGWTHEDGATRESVFRGGVVAQVHPSERGLFLLGGLGWSGYRAGSFRYDAGHLTVGAGWDLALAPGWVVGNSVSVDAASFGSLRNGNATVARDVGLSVVRLTVHVRRNRGG